MDRYAARPQALNNMCLADFASVYGKKSTVPTSDIEPDISDDESEDTDISPQSIRLQNNLGIMIKRKVPAIIRSHQWSIHRNPQQFYFAQLLLYFPWREEATDLCPRNSTYKDFYSANEVSIAANRSRYEHHAEDVAQAIEDLEQYGPPEDSWQMLAPQTEQAQSEDRTAGAEEEQTVYSGFETSEVTSRSSMPDILPHQYDFAHESMSTPEWFSMIHSLNSLQYELHDFILCSMNFMISSSNGAFK